VTEGTTGQQPECSAALTALARGGEGVDWQRVELHLSTCPSCAAGLDRFTTAVNEQFAASRLLLAVEDDTPDPAAPDTSTAAATEDGGDGGRLLIFPTPAAEQRRPAVARGRRLFIWAGAAAAALIVLVAAGAVVGRSGSGGAKRAVADRRPGFVPILDVLPQRSDNTYHNGELIQVHLGINQPSRVVLSVLEGHNTTTLLDIDQDPGERYIPYRVVNLRQRATLRVEVFVGLERVARKDVTLQPAAATPVP
jgi:hypothetical protein